jgi:hypothetical protein
MFLALFYYDGIFGCYTEQRRIGLARQGVSGACVGRELGRGTIGAWECNNYVIQITEIP